ncbi:protein of unknown function [Sporobacter termitidis DSM 10068]|uniref:DUF4317 family protein n=1 Tax=Sporobacter termitidis DSM 10068 TaxID=1123282 RepID=A0A1M5YC84_9FIRM|nr:DUF4317 family protein [Sporobacter termitidis]SHI09645.1 protein of unknown function [Sporobacter termitidis DSM 10068]
MNKKELSAFRRQFKADSYQLQLKQLYTAYIKKDNQNILYAELCSFDMKSETEQEIYLSNFKKLLTGGFNSKLFELSFDDGAPEGEGQARFRQLLGAEREAFADCCNKYIAQVAANFNYDSDVVISFASGKYNKPMGRRGRKGEEESLDGFDDTSFGFNFVLCSVCRADDVKRGIYYSASSEKFELNSALDKTVNFLSPVDGFMFPAFNDNCADINKLLYYTAKANVRNEALLENVLHCRYEPTAREEQEKFGEILRLVNGEKIKPELLKNIYEAVSEKIEAYADDGEQVTLDASELKDILEESGVADLEGFESAFNQAADEGFEFKAASLVSGAAQMKINTGVGDIAVNLADLGSVRQVINARGRKCLQIELSDDAELNGMVLETENI